MEVVKLQTSWTSNIKKASFGGKQMLSLCCWHHMESKHIMGLSGGGVESEWTLHVVGTFMTQWGSVSFAAISNFTCHRNFTANCHATGTKKTWRDKKLLMKCFHLFVIWKAGFTQSSRDAIIKVKARSSLRIQIKLQNQRLHWTDFRIKPTTF